MHCLCAIAVKLVESENELGHLANLYVKVESSMLIQGKADCSPNPDQESCFLGLSTSFLSGNKIKNTILSLKVGP